MAHRCTQDCPFKMDLDAAAAGLAETSRVLSQSIMISSDEMIESYYAMVRGAKARLQGARAAWLDHLAEAG